MMLLNDRKLSNEKLNTLASNVDRLSRLLTRQRENLPAAYLKDRGLREAYAAYFLPPNMRKIHIPLSELALHPDTMVNKEQYRILDLGCGPGTALLGVLDFFYSMNISPRLDVVAIDQLSENLAIVRSFFSTYKLAHSLNASLKTICSSIGNTVHMIEEPFDLITLTNVLNELHPHHEMRIAKRIRLLADLLHRYLAKDGSCIIIEPALRETSRELLQVRDGLLEAGFCIYAPCLCTTACPALKNPNDWCHEDVSWDPPVLIRNLDKLTGLRKNSLKFSYIVLRKDNRTLGSQLDAHTFRIVSEPLTSKGKFEFYFCGIKGRKLVTRLEKDKASLNAVLSTLHRGDIVNTKGLIDEGKRYKVGKDTSIECFLSHQPCSSTK